MTFAVLARSLRDQRRGLIGWGIAIVVTVVAMASIWPSVRDMPGIEDLMAGYPEAMSDLFNLEDFRSGAGYLNAELFSSMLPILLLVFAIGRGARLVAGDEEAGLFEVVLSTPVSRTRVLVEKATALVASIAVLGAVTFLATWGSALAVGMDLPVGQLAAGVLANVLLASVFGLLAVAVGAFTGHRAVAIAVSSVGAVAAYLLYVLGQLVSWLEPWAVLSPYHQAISAGPIGGGLSPWFLVLALLGVVAVAVAAPRFERRDIGS